MSRIGPGTLSPLVTFRIHRLPAANIAAPSHQLLGFAAVLSVLVSNASIAQSEDQGLSQQDEQGSKEVEALQADAETGEPENALLFGYERVLHRYPALSIIKPSISIASWSSSTTLGELASRLLSARSHVR